jgi:hypothetical protein
VDETFLERMLLVFMDLATGYLLLEEVAEDRTYATWKALVDERLKALGTGVLYGVSDRAQALIQLAEHGLECLSVPDFFHVVHEIDTPDPPSGAAWSYLGGPLNDIAADYRRRLPQGAWSPW